MRRNRRAHALRLLHGHVPELERRVGDGHGALEPLRAELHPLIHQLRGGVSVYFFRDESLSNKRQVDGVDARGRVVLERLPRGRRRRRVARRRRRRGRRGRRRRLARRRRRRRSRDVRAPALPAGRIRGRSASAASAAAVGSAASAASAARRVYVPRRERRRGRGRNPGRGPRGGSVAPVRGLSVSRAYATVDPTTAGAPWK